MQKTICFPFLYVFLCDLHSQINHGQGKNTAVFPHSFASDMIRDTQEMCTCQTTDLAMCLTTSPSQKSCKSSRLELQLPRPKGSIFYILMAISPVLHQIVCPEVTQLLNSSLPLIHSRVSFFLICFTLLFQSSCIENSVYRC